MKEINIKVDNLNLSQLDLSQLNLSQYYEPMRKISEELHDINPGFFDENGNFVDIFNPDAYSLRLYNIIHEDKLYIGNEQIPYTNEYDNKENTYNLIDYWFRGKNCNFNILYQFSKVHNKSINYKGYGCNQHILNIIKEKIIELIGPSLNVNNIGTLDNNNNNIKSWYGKNISLYKQALRKIFKEMSIEELSEYLLMIIDDMENNLNKWANMLYFNNRYWLISDIQEDIEKRNKFFEGNNHVDDKYIGILIILKELLLWEFGKVYKCNYYKSIFSKKEYIKNPKCKSLDLYKAKNLFTHKKPIELILSICYKEVYEGTVNNYYKEYMEFKERLYKQIYSE